ncbi:MAG: type I secretion system permease/ATPase, partial [Verrucomicrobiota bacterium]
RRLDRFHAATLPVVLLLEDNDAVILLRYGRGKSAEVSVLSAGGGVQKVKLKDLERSYTGHAILVAPTYEFDASSDFVPPPPKRNWFWGTLLRFSGFYARVGCATIMINLLALTSSLFIMNVYDRVVPNQAIDTLFALAAGAVAAFLLEFALKSLRTFFVDRAGHRIDLILGGDLFAQVMGMRFDAKPPSSGALAGQARSYEGLREFFTSATVAALVDLPFIFVFAGIVFLLGGPVAIPLIAGAVLSLTIAGLVQIPMSQAVRKGYLAGNQRQGLFVEGVNAMETVKATRSESELQARMEASVHIGSKADGQARGLAQFALNSNGLIQHLVTVGMVVMAFYQIRAEQMSMGAMIACVILAGRAMAPLMIVSSLLARLQQSRRALKGLNEIMKAPSERAGKEGQYIRLEKFEPRVRFRDLDFGHHPDSGLVLKQLGFDVEPGERVALLGRVGAGKSTLLRLLMGFYQATGGRIDVSGVEIQQLDPAQLRGWMGYVPQEPTLLLGSLRSNIKAGCPQASDSAVWQAVERAGLADFVRSLPRGLDHPVAEGGKSLSGGQRQAVALARAFLEEPPLLVLDEPTSAMDWNSEQALLERLDSYLAEDKTRTLIVATHKRSVLSIVERAIVIDNGSVVADGPKDRVMSPGVRVRNTPATKIHAVRSEPDGEVALPSIDSPDFESY